MAIHERKTALMPASNRVVMLLALLVAVPGGAPWRRRCRPSKIQMHSPARVCEMYCAKNTRFFLIG